MCDFKCFFIRVRVCAKGICVCMRVLVCACAGIIVYILTHLINRELYEMCGRVRKEIESSAAWGDVDLNEEESFQRVFIYAHAHPHHIYPHAHARTHPCTRILTHAHAHAHAKAHTHAHTYARAHPHAHTSILAHTHAHS